MFQSHLLLCCLNIKRLKRNFLSLSFYWIEIPFTIKQIEIIKNPDSQFYPLFQFAKKYRKEKQEYFDKPYKEKVKILTKEINRKEKEIKNELLHLRMVQIVNDELLSKKFLTSEKTFFDRKIKCE